MKKLSCLLIILLLVLSCRKEEDIDLVLEKINEVANKGDMKIVNQL